MPHLDEGTIHAWIEGALPPDEAALVEEHVAGCDECGAAVAEARGLIAAASRMLTALDDIPGGVIPSRAPRPTPWYMRRELQAAAAVLIVAGMTLLVTRGGRQQEMTASRAALGVRSVVLDTGVAPPPETAVAAAPVGGSKTPKRAETKPASVTARVPAAIEQSFQKEIESKEARDIAEPPKALALAPTASPATIGTPMRVVSVDRRIGRKQTTYEISPGVQVVLVEEPATALSEVVVTGTVAGVAPTARRAESARLQSARQKTRDSTLSPTVQPAPAETQAPGPSPAQINSIQWTDPETGSRYTLTGPLTREQLELVKARLAEAKQ